MDWGGEACRELRAYTSILSNYRIESGLLASLGLIRNVVRPGIQKEMVNRRGCVLDGDSDLTQNRISLG